MRLILLIKKKILNSYNLLNLFNYILQNPEKCLCFVYLIELSNVFELVFIFPKFKDFFDFILCIFNL